MEMKAEPEIMEMKAKPEILEMKAEPVLMEMMGKRVKGKTIVLFDIDKTLAVPMKCVDEEMK